MKLSSNITTVALSDNVSRYELCLCRDCTTILGR